MSTDEYLCEPCRDGEHEHCTNKGCLCIDLEHDADDGDES